MSLFTPSRCLERTSKDLDYSSSLQKRRPIFYYKTIFLNYAGISARCIQKSKILFIEFSETIEKSYDNMQKIENYLKTSKKRLYMAEWILFFAYFCLFFSCKVPHYKFSWFWHLLYIWSNVPEQYNKQEPVKSRLAGGSRDLTLLCQCLLEISLTSFCFIFSSKAYEKSLIQGCRYLASMTRKTFKNVSCQRVRSILP